MFNSDSIKALLFLFTISVLPLFSCSQNLPEAEESYRKIISLILEDDFDALAKLVVYPLKRVNPLPDIKDQNEFISKYSLLFDSAFKLKLKQFDPSDIFERNGAYGLVGGVFDGDVWINESGRIIGFNYLSSKEEEIKTELIRKQKEEVHPSINLWERSIIIARTDKLLIRVDETTEGLRYVCWSQGHKMSDKPDVVLNDGVMEVQGSMGGWSFTFSKNDWSYVVDEVDICEDEKDCGLFLKLFFKGAPKNTYRLQRIR